ncbi:Cytochrome P450 [Dillenia turbinata]|uniref:Cytochrome P450 n=1 Tax=Dillenia turbinata TaxID=194707 RepID=A0AAN8W935_9MAGN
MEISWSFLSWTVLTLSLLIHFLWPKRPRNFPPGPRGWPMIGNMLELSKFPHREMVALKEKYGPVVGLRVGASNIIVILSADVAANFFKNHDAEFADRFVPDVTKCRDFHKGSLSLAPYGTPWRVLRRIGTMEMLVGRRLNVTAPIRRKCVDQMLFQIENEARNLKPIHVPQLLFYTSFNILGNMIFSRNLLDPSCKDVSGLCKAIKGMLELSAVPNLADAYPWLGRLDLQGLRCRMNNALDEAIGIASRFVQERKEERQMRVEQNRPKDFLDVLLDYEGDGKEEPADFSEHTINIFILELFVGGADTTSVTIDWVMSELLCKPECMAKVKDELNRVVGPNNKLEESHIDELHYLQAVVKETLRLHPPVPFLVPRKAIKDTKFMGYDIPKDTEVFVNAWAIGRDEDNWAEPNCFNPERFLGSKMDYKGQHYEFIPFGSGRRMCMGLPLAHRMLHFISGSLLHCFDWELEKSVTRDMMDVEKMRVLTLRKAEDLQVMAKKRTTLKK